MTWRRQKGSTVLSYGPLKYSVVKGFGRMSSGVEIVGRALENAGGVKKDAAELMGISQRALSYYLAKYRID